MTNYQDSQMGVLYLVPTPIGNLDDMTFRAIKILKSVSLILAEDTRHSIKLMNHFDIQTKLSSFHQHNQEQKLGKALEILLEGQDLALISDAGMPVINDPGHPLVLAAIEAGVQVVALPGPNAALTALVASGLSAERFTYYGFFPRDNKHQASIIDQIASRDETAIFYESPYRVQKMLLRLAEGLSGDTPVVLGRELTKRYEEYIRMPLGQLNEFLNDQALKGEFVVLVGGGHARASVVPVEETGSIRDQVLYLIESEAMSSKQAIKEVAQRNGLKKQTVYSAYHQLDTVE